MTIESLGYVLKMRKNMVDDKDKTLKALHDLVATCNDAAEGYAKAAKGVHDTDLSNWLARISNERERFGADLTATIKALGGESRADLHEGGILHAGWMDLEQRPRPKDERDILQSCIAGDTGTLKHYDHALAQDLSPGVRSIVEEQRTAVERDLASLQSGAKQHKTQHA
jgi:uncharacterized protein (TIGR02284 family)